MILAKVALEAVTRDPKCRQAERIALPDMPGAAEAPRAMISEAPRRRCASTAGRRRGDLSLAITLGPLRWRCPPGEVHRAFQRAWLETAPVTEKIISTGPWGHQPRNEGQRPRLSIAYVEDHWRVLPIRSRATKAQHSRRIWL